MSPRRLAIVLTLIVFYQTFANLCIQHPSTKIIKTFPHTTLVECRGLCWLIPKCTFYRLYKNTGYCYLGLEVTGTEKTSECKAGRDVKNKPYFRKNRRPPISCAGCFPGCKLKMDRNVNGQLDRDADSPLDRDVNSQLDKDANNQLDRDADSQLDRDVNSPLDRDVNIQLDKDANSQLDRDADSQLDRDVNSQLDKHTVDPFNVSTSTKPESEHGPITATSVPVDKKRKMKREPVHCPMRIEKYTNEYFTCNLTSDNIVIVNNNITGLKVRSNLDLTHDKDTLLFMSYEVKSGRQRFCFNTRIKGRWARETRHYPKKKIGKELWPYQVRVCPKVFKIRLNKSRPIYIPRRSSKFPALVQTSQNFFIEVKVMKTYLPCKRKKRPV